MTRYSVAALIESSGSTPCFNAEWCTFTRLSYYELFEHARFSSRPCKQGSSSFLCPFHYYFPEREGVREYLRDVSPCSAADPERRSLANLPHSPLVHEGGWQVKNRRQSRARHEVR